VVGAYWEGNTSGIFSSIDTGDGGGSFRVVLSITDGITVGVDPTIAGNFNNDNTGKVKIGDKVNYTPDSGVTSYVVSGVRCRKSDTY